jgi:hypothetical protein
MNKTERKNKTNLVINWPVNGELFTVKQLWASNPQFPAEITLRVRVDNAIKREKNVALIGYKNSGKGRPSMILSMNPVSQELLDQAYKDGVQKPEPTAVQPVINILEVNNTTSISTTEQTIIDIPVNAPTEPEMSLTNNN